MIQAECVHPMSWQNNEGLSNKNDCITESKVCATLAWNECAHRSLAGLSRVSHLQVCPCTHVQRLMVTNMNQSCLLCQLWAPLCSALRYFYWRNQNSTRRTTQLNNSLRFDYILRPPHHCPTNRHQLDECHTSTRFVCRRLDFCAINWIFVQSDRLLCNWPVPNRQPPGTRNTRWKVIKNLLIIQQAGAELCQAQVRLAS